MSEWNQSRIQTYIDSGTQEATQVEYKRAEALGKSDGKKNEISKDVSAMANAAGGIIIYGLTENDNDLPEKIDPLNPDDFSRETLDQIISDRIKPRIPGVVIHPIFIDGDNKQVVYVVEVPKGSTAHQASDKRYHTRLNTTIRKMEDHEIRDIMQRDEFPDLQLDRFRCILNPLEYDLKSENGNSHSSQIIQLSNIIFSVRNTSPVWANQIRAGIVGWTINNNLRFIENIFNDRVNILSPTIFERLKIWTLYQELTTHGSKHIAPYDTINIQLSTSFNLAIRIDDLWERNYKWASAIMVVPQNMPPQWFQLVIKIDPEFIKWANTEGRSHIRSENVEIEKLDGRIPTISCEVNPE